MRTNMQLERAITKGKVNIMKKVFTTFVTVLLTAAVIFGTLVAYDQYKEREARIEKRTERCEKNDEIFDEYLDFEAAAFAKRCFERGYTIDVTYTYHEGMKKYRATWSNLNEDDFARFLQTEDLKGREIEELAYDTYVATYDDWR